MLEPVPGDLNPKESVGNPPHNMEFIEATSLHASPTLEDEVVALTQDYADTATDIVRISERMETDQKHLAEIRERIGIASEAQPPSLVRSEERLLELTAHGEDVLRRKEALMGKPVTEVTAEGKREVFEEISQEVHQARGILELKAHERGSLETKTYERRAGSLSEVETIAQGIADPHEMLPELVSDQVIVSYSRRNEPEANFIHLALRSAGLSVWFDNQETNVSVEDPYAVGPVGIGMGQEWPASINHGIPRAGHGVEYLSHDVLDKCDIICGTEVPQILENGNRLLVVAREDESRGSLRDRLEKMSTDPAYREYGDALKALLNSPTITVDQKHFSGSYRDLGNVLVPWMTGKKPPEHHVSPRSQREPDSTQETNGKVMAERFSGRIEVLRTSVQELKQSAEPKDLPMLDRRLRALDESEMLFHGAVAPEILAKTLEKGSFVPVKAAEGEVQAVDKLQPAFQKLGLAESSEGYRLVPLSGSALRESVDTLRRELQAARRSEGENLWLLALDREVIPTLGEMESDQSADGTRPPSYWLASSLLEKQMIPITENDLGDPDALASYIVTKQALVESAYKVMVRAREEED